MKDSISLHLDANNLINKSQHGFTKGRSCTKKLAGVSGKATSVVDDGRLFDVIFLDFSKAFDKVPRERLLY